MILNLSETPYIVHSSRIRRLLELARSNCDWCNSLQRQSLIGHSRDKLVLYLNKVQKHLETIDSQIHEVYKDFLQALVGRSPATVANILRNRLPSIINATYSIHSGIHTDMVTHLTEAGNLVLEMLRLITPKCSSELAKYEEQHADAKHRIYQNTDDITAKLEKEQFQIEGMQHKYIAGEKTLQEVAKDIHLDDTVSKISTQINQIQDSLGDRILAASRMERHINVLYFWIAAQLNDTYLVGNSRYFEQLNVSEVKTGPPLVDDLQEFETLRPGAVADVSPLSDTSCCKTKKHPTSKKKKKKKKKNATP